VTGGGVAAGTRITRIDPATRVITLSANPTITGTARVTFGLPTRTFVQSNGVGIVLASGAATIANTDIGGNGRDGVQILGGSHSIGSTKLSLTTNAIFGNGGRGVSIVNAGIAAAQRISNNYFGLSVSGSATATFTANVGGNVMVNGIVPADFVPSSQTWVDRLGNRHRPLTGTISSGPTFPWRPT
jgi:hypothetical protein